MDNNEKLRYRLLDSLATGELDIQNLPQIVRVTDGGLYIRALMSAIKDENRFKKIKRLMKSDLEMLRVCKPDNWEYEAQWIISVYKSWKFLQE